MLTEGQFVVLLKAWQQGWRDLVDPQDETVTGGYCNGYIDGVDDAMIMISRGLEELWGLNINTVQSILKGVSVRYGEPVEEDAEEALARRIVENDAAMEGGTR